MAEKYSSQVEFQEAFTSSRMTSLFLRPPMTSLDGGFLSRAISSQVIHKSSSSFESVTPPTVAVDQIASKADIADSPLLYTSSPEVSAHGPSLPAVCGQRTGLIRASFIPTLAFKNHDPWRWNENRYSHKERRETVTSSQHKPISYLNLHICFNTSSSTC